MKEAWRNGETVLGCEAEGLKLKIRYKQGDGCLPQQRTKIENM